MKTTKSIRMDESLVNAITARAEKERRTFHSMTLCLLEDALKQSSGDVIWMTEKEAQALTAKEMDKAVVTTKARVKTVSGSFDDETAIINYLNLVSGSNYQHVESNKKLIRARIAEGRTVGEIKSVIDRQNREWPTGDSQRKYLRPATLFNAEKFNQYFGQVGQPLNRDLPNGQRKSAYQQRVEAGDERSFNIDTDF